MAYLKCCHSSRLILRLFGSVVPKIDNMVNKWDKYFHTNNTNVIFSMSDQMPGQKRNHIIEYSILSLYPEIDSAKSLRFIVPFTIITNYLEDLVKKAGPRDAESFNQIFSSLWDSVDPKRILGNYYQYHPYIDDHGYLARLVEECRGQVIKNDSFKSVVGPVKKLIKLYSEIQFFKYLREPYREEMIYSWAGKYNNRYPEILYFEYLAAADSILGIFALFTCSLGEHIDQDEAEKIYNAYFPWICGLQKLLVSYVNVQKDTLFNSFNPTYYYKNLKACEERISFFVERALESCKTLSQPDFHKSVVEYLIAKNLTDPRVLTGINKLASLNIQKRISSTTNLHYNLCKLLRFIGKID